MRLACKRRYQYHLLYRGLALVYIYIYIYIYIYSGNLCLGTLIHTHRTSTTLVAKHHEKKAHIFKTHKISIMKRRK